MSSPYLSDSHQAFAEEVRRTLRERAAAPGGSRRGARPPLRGSLAGAGRPRPAEPAAARRGLPGKRGIPRGARCARLCRRPRGDRRACLHGQRLPGTVRQRRAAPALSPRHPCRANHRRPGHQRGTGRQRSVANAMQGRPRRRRFRRPWRQALHRQWFARLADRHPGAQRRRRACAGQQQPAADRRRQPRPQPYAAADARLAQRGRLRPGFQRRRGIRRQPARQAPARRCST
ncbi:Uncharacterised protein [Streptococcus dysgalactiae subsp. equisimilis]|nr:Uncharacterised protein [Streptococcus dysgalactiae subsp. equisimilis]